MTQAEQESFLRESHTVNFQVDNESDHEVGGDAAPEPDYTALNRDFEQYPLVQFSQYSNALYRILRHFDTLRHRLPEFVAKFGFGPKEIAIYKSNFDSKNNWAYYVMRDILNQTTRPEIANMTLTKFVTLLSQIKETRLICRDIYEQQGEILAEFMEKKLVTMPAVLVYRRATGARSNATNDHLTNIDVFKQQLKFNNFEVEDIYAIEPARQESELRRSQAVFIVFDEVLNQIFDETLPFTPEPGDLDFRNIGRILYHDFLVNDCRNERIYLFLTPGMNTRLHQAFKFPWLLRENNLNFVNDQELTTRPHANRVRTYKKPTVLPDDTGYVNNLDHPERNNIDALLGSIYTNHYRSNRNFR